MQSTLVTAGVDVSKAELVTCVLPGKHRRSFLNTPAGSARLCDWLREHQVSRVAFEPTGGYERTLHQALARAALPAWQVNPRQARSYGMSLGQLDKTDPQDAEVLADYARQERFRDTPPLSEPVSRLRALLRARSGVVRAELALRCAAKMAPAEARRVLRSSAGALQRRLIRIGALITVAVASDERLQRQARRLATVPGIAALTAAQLLAELPEMGVIPRAAVCRLAGVAPARRQSGEHERPAHIRGGRPRVRQALYMPTWAAVQHNPRLRVLYKRLVDKGRPKKVALVACMHKLLIWCDALLRHERDWDTERVM